MHLLLIGFFGVLIGSFLNVVILRLPSGLTLNGRSHCFNCGHNLNWLDLIPIFSYLSLKGKCRYCHANISPRYAYIEIITGILYALIVGVMSPQGGYEWLETARVLLVSSVLVAIFVIDLEHYIILDSLTFFLSAVILLLNICLDMLAGTSLFSLASHTGSGVLGAIVAFLPFFSIWFFSKGKWMGFGDVKFMLPFGAVLGWPLVVLGMFSAFFMGAIVSVYLLVAGGKGLKSQIPFGTFLSVACVLALLWGHKLWAAYLSLIGF